MLDYDSVLAYAKHIHKRNGSATSLRNVLYAICRFYAYMDIKPDQIIEEVKRGKLNIVEALNKYNSL